MDVVGDAALVEDLVELLVIDTRRCMLRSSLEMIAVPH